MTLRSLLGRGARFVRTEIKRADMEQLVAKTSRARTGEKVVFWVPGGMPLMLHVEGAIAMALQLRGVDVHLVICDGPFRACVRRDVRTGEPIEQWASACAGCRAGTTRVLRELALPHSFIGDYVTDAQRQALVAQARGATWESVADLNRDGVDIGKNVRSAVTRYLQGESLVDRERLVEEYAATALIVREAAARAFDVLAPTRVFMSHGVYADWGPALQVAHHRGLPIVGWMAGFLPARFYLRNIESVDHLDFHAMSEPAWSERSRTPLTAAEDERLDRYLSDRYRRPTSFDMKHFHPYSEEMKELRRRYVVDPKKRLVGVIAHINWDTVCDYSPMAYPSFDEWMVDTLNVIHDVTDVQWLIKVHPAEAWDNPASGVEQLVKTRFPNLPPHIRLISATEPISPLNFVELIDAGVTVYGTVGVELALHGKPVLLAGHAPYGRKGFTRDALTIDTYRAALRDPGGFRPLSDEQTALARRYAYAYFIQRQIPLRIVESDDRHSWSFDHERRELLAPGADPFVDLVCERILDGRDFILDDELVRAADARRRAAKG